MIEIKTAVTDQDIAFCWEAMSLLRPMLKENEFVNQIKEMQKEGYTLLYISDDDKAVSLAGYRFWTMLYCSKLLYIDDLSTLEKYRGKGYASALLNHIYGIAKEQNCKSVQLDSGPARTDAHKLYFKENFTINAYHFNKQL
ncbi:GNAT family N-acetyltransferase [Flavobacterium marginilacus]|uniref:GNAT family N-acetyltransferase n=1 Tax=Flavobacterium marginilacus TaxID=3003256 RepID=UPI00248D563F|nr:GNAT family N-acetyltransferase [Flavobacterium marginilacus]